ncbi:winged helix-turn-helix domain-containing protein [Mucilaginibacter sp. OK098]|uniref:winged helix-turn-helix domain-containing protein n=1 Tax=Mucilaginibacter sp. OK098 TaxID=1855297 RepID=UPI00090FCD68|nr:winged helix-turn-helix domain-containing protein [Mucilaginibacter sp. OK098]SHM01486.1 molybdate transport system regulatory protein [Mucilaginibacter sp. OK098]
MNDSKFNLDGRIWIETAGEKILGHGRVELLERIKESGSIRQAALQMKMSYKQAWDLINHMNTHFTSPVVISHRGGKGGGNAVVTDYGLKVISQFHSFQVKLKAFLAENSSEINL